MKTCNTAELISRINQMEKFSKKFSSFQKKFYQFNLTKYHLSGKICIRVIIRNKILKRRKYTSTTAHGEQTNLEMDKKSRNHGNVHQLQPLQPQRTGLFMLWLGYGKPWMNQLTRECDSTLYIVIYPTM